MVSRKSRVFATTLAGQYAVVEVVTIEIETSRGNSPVTSEVLVFSVRTKAAQTGRCSHDFAEALHQGAPALPVPCR